MKTELLIHNQLERDQVAAILIRNGYIVSQRVVPSPEYVLVTGPTFLVVEKALDEKA